MWEERSGSRGLVEIGVAITAKPARTKTVRHNFDPDCFEITFIMVVIFARMSQAGRYFRRTLAEL